MNINKFANIGVTEFRIYTDKTRKHLRQVWQVHNDVKQAMIGREILWTVQTTTTEPIAKMRLKIEDSTTMPTYDVGFGSDGDNWQEWTISHTASQVEKIIQLDILNATSVVYADITDLNINLNPDEVLDVIYKHVWDRSEGQIGDIYLAKMKEWFVSAVQSSKVYQMLTTLTYDGSTLDFVALTNIDEGGKVTDDYVILSGSHRNTQATGSITEVKLYSPLEIPYLIHTEIPDAVPWALNSTKKIKVKFTWAEVV